MIKYIINHSKTIIKAAIITILIFVVNYSQADDKNEITISNQKFKITKIIAPEFKIHTTYEIQTIFETKLKIINNNTIYDYQEEEIKATYELAIVNSTSDSIIASFKLCDLFYFYSTPQITYDFDMLSNDTINSAIKRIPDAFQYLKGYVILYNTPIAVVINFKEKTITIQDETKYFNLFSKTFNYSQQQSDANKNNISLFLNEFIQTLLGSIIQESNINVEVLGNPHWEHYFSRKFLSYPVEFKSINSYTGISIETDKIENTIQSLKDKYTIAIAQIPCTFSRITGKGSMSYNYKQKYFKHSRIEMESTGTIMQNNIQYQVKASQTNVCNIKIKNQ
ncbi:MAG: hypothetical protein AB1444_15200 [Spirochaetota bacterium]